MKITINAFKNENLVHMSERNEQKNTGEKKTIFAGNTNLLNDPIAQRRKEAQEAAWKIVKNAWDNDTAVDNMVQERQEHYTKMEEQRATAQKELSEIEEEKESLREIYSAEDEEYMSRIEEMEERADELRKQMHDADVQMRDSMADIRSIGLERLKSNPMVEAQDAADAINEAANDEIIGMLLQESKEYIEEKREEAKEEAEKAMEKKEEKEELQEKIKLERAIQEAMIEGTKEAVDKAKAMERRSEFTNVEVSDMVQMTQGAEVSKGVEQSLDEIKQNMNLLEADLKGIKVDEEV